LSGIFKINLKNNITNYETTTIAYNETSVSVERVPQFSHIIGRAVSATVASEKA
jgi:hypothetical protein